MSKKTSELLAAEHEYQTKVYNESEAIEFLQTIPSRLLGQVIKGEIDLNKLARFELSNRGHDNDGRWVGFKEAAKIHQVVI